MGNSGAKQKKEQVSEKQDLESFKSDTETVAEDNYSSPVGTSAVDLFSLVRSGNGTEIERLLQYPSNVHMDVNIEDENGHTPLMLAALQNDLKTVQVLLKSGANVRVQSSKTCTTALQEAILNDVKDDVITFLQQEEDKTLGCIMDLFKPNRPLPELMCGVSVDERRDDGCTPLMVHAAHDFKADVVEKLLELGAQIDLQDEKGYTALMFAVEGGHLETVQKLLENGSSVNITNKDHKTPLDLAKGHDIAEILHQASKKPVVTFESLLANFLSQSQARTSVDVPARSSRSVPRPSALPIGVRTDDSPIPKELQEDWNTIAELEVEVHELTLKISADDPSGGSKDDSSYSFMEIPRLDEEHKKMEEQKEKMKQLAVDAKKASQRLSAENIQLKDDLRNMELRNKTEKEAMLKDLEELRQRAALADKKIEAVCQAQVFQKKMSEFVSASTGEKKHPKECTLDLPSLIKYNYDVEVSLLCVVISGLPNSGKSKIWSYLVSAANASNKDECFSIQETVHIFDGHSWDGIPVNKTEGSAMGIGVGITQAYAKDGDTPTFVLPDKSKSDKILQSVYESQDHFPNIKKLSLINVWDIGVNRELFFILSLLLPQSKRLVLLAALNLVTDCGDLYSSSVNTDEQGQDMPSEPFTKLDYLMLPSSTARCRTIAVATHSGELPREKLRYRHQKVQRAVKAKAEEMGIGGKLYPKCIAVNTSNQHDLMRIKNVLSEIISQTHEECKTKVPLTWLYFRDVLNNCEDWYMSKEKLIEEAKKCGISDECNVEKFLKMYRKCGSIIYSPCNTSSILHDHVILKPHLFFENVKKLLPLSGGRIVPPQTQSQQFTLKVLEDADLVITLKRNNPRNSRLDNTVEYIMPPLHSKYALFSIQAKSSSLYVKFSLSVLPCHYLVKFIKTLQRLYSQWEIDCIPGDCCNRLSLKLVRGHKSADVAVLVFNNCLEVKIATECNDLEVYSVLKSAAIDFAQSVCSPAHPDLWYQLNVACSLKPHLIPFHALDVVDPDSALDCHLCKRPIDIAAMWLAAPYKGPRSMALTAADILADDLIVTLSHELALLTKRQIEQLGESLGYSAAVTGEVMSLYPTVQEFIFSMLQTWKKGCPASVREKLSKALAECGYLTCLSEVHVLSDYTPLMKLQLSNEECELVYSLDCDRVPIMKKLNLKDKSDMCKIQRSKLIDALYNFGEYRIAELLLKRIAQQCDVYVK